jgi:DNA-binding CsgD family transcriptional regulator
MLFTQNSSTLNRLKSILISHKSKIEPVVFNELDHTIIESLNYNTSVHWEMFKKRFDNLHINFNATLILKYPNLSPADQKLATLIKLGLSTKEISIIQQNTPESIQVGRSRLRKKMKLSISDNLSAILAKIQ